MSEHRRSERDVDPKLQRHLVTPEGVKLTIQLAPKGDRAGAFLLDAVIIFVAMVLVSLVGRSLWSEPDAGYARTVMQLLFFLLLNFYFMVFELKWSGATPGKRVFRLRVVDRRGGQLTSDAIVVRNFMRQIEIFLPLGVLLAPEMLWPGATGWSRLLASSWVLLGAGLPFFNKEHLRIGDLVAGTMVVLSPKAILLPDLEEQRRHNPFSSTKKAMAPSHYTFTDEQLSHYGIYELQVLEDLLRKEEEQPQWETVEAISKQIQKKIGWRSSKKMANHLRFLQEFHSAQRRFLEEHMLFGKRREDKFAPK